MLHSTLLLSVLASALAAQASPLLADSLLPSFALVTPGATIEPPSSTAPKITPTSSPVDNDQPDPYNSSIQLPATLSFNPSQAPAFTAEPGEPDPSSNVAYPSTPCSTLATVTPAPIPIDDGQPDASNSSVQLPASESFNPSNAPAFTATSGGVDPSSNPVYASSTPCSSKVASTAAPSIATPIETMTTKTPSNGKATLSSSSAAAPTPALKDDKTPSDATKPTPSKPTRSPVPTSNRPSYPIGGSGPAGIDHPNKRPAFGWGRPRPAGAWPGRVAGWPVRGSGNRAKPTPVRPVAGKRKGEGKPTSTPCSTLQTRVRATPTGM
ncbi:hypothetical protein HBI81_126830 [Parastagonospora nodorum]|nr:hypothetical protein HBI81_126830 [Parastagonospora nodorum]